MKNKGGSVTPITKPQEGQAAPKPVELSPEAQVNAIIKAHRAKHAELTLGISELETRLEQAKEAKIKTEAYIEAFAYANNLHVPPPPPAPAKKERKPRAQKSHKALGSTVEPVVPPAE